MNRCVMEPVTKPDKLQVLIMRQNYCGDWTWSEDLLKTLGLDEEPIYEHMERAYHKLTGLELKIDTRHWRNILSTFLVVKFFRTQALDSQDVWELIVDKANAWIKASMNSLGR